MEKSFSDHVAEILGVSENNTVLKNLLLDGFYSGLPDNVSRNVKKVLNSYDFKPRGKAGWQCQHKGCREQSCFSHEISENAVLKNLCKTDSNVIVLKRDIQGNPIYFVEDSQHKRNATNFPGYCSEHDAVLFADIDSGVQLFGEHYVNKQCLRSTRAQIFELDLQIKCCDIFNDDIPCEIQDDEEVLAVVKYFDDKRSGLELRRKRLWEIYDRIFDGIQRGSYVVGFKNLTLGVPGFCFSACVDLTIEGDMDACLIYVCKLDLKSSIETFVAYLKNDISEKLCDEFLSRHPIHFADLMYQRKRKIILSADLASSLSGNVKEILYKDDELYEIGPIEHWVISMGFFGSANT
ncbi:hypothetical protein [Pseudomonas chlororaphis]|uniref:hypothetical protein n=1 Tax=Pseudomonas chlororaphis TaxID=587753 RepID=UPI00117BD9E8|nr:hypothetical protein [Pseudomonas chlororaphis]